MNEQYDKKIFGCLFWFIIMILSPWIFSTLLIIILGYEITLYIFALIILSFISFMIYFNYKYYQNDKP